ncbi:MAG: glutamine synthetase family protein, partial [Pseudomonadota bacterium]
LELEFTLFDQATTKAGTLGPARDPMTGRSELHGMLNVDRLDGYEAFVEEVLANCDAQGIDTTAICSEFGNNQFEINFTHYEDPLKAADKAQLYKRTVKAVARKHGFLASFMAKPDLQLPSNGQHIHVSVVDEAGANIFSNGDTHTDTLMHAIAGLQAGAKDAMLCWAPNINSYRRFEPGFCVPTGPTWAYDHRHIAFRIPPGTGQAWRIENRLAGADANCYLSLAATLAAMLVGIDRKLTPSAETKGAPPLDYESLPLTIRDAIAAMRDGSVIKSILGADFIELYASYREGELDAFEGVITPRELDWYL